MVLLLASGFACLCCCGCINSVGNCSSLIVLILLFGILYLVAACCLLMFDYYCFDCLLLLVYGCLVGFDWFVELVWFGVFISARFVFFGL